MVPTQYGVRDSVNLQGTYLSSQLPPKRCELISIGSFQVPAVEMSEFRSFRIRFDLVKVLGIKIDTS